MSIADYFTKRTGPAPPPAPAPAPIIVPANTYNGPVTINNYAAPVHMAEPTQSSRHPEKKKRKRKRKTERKRRGKQERKEEDSIEEDKPVFYRENGLVYIPFKLGKCLPYKKHGKKMEIQTHAIVDEGVYDKMVKLNNSKQKRAWRKATAHENKSGCLKQVQLGITESATGLLKIWTSENTKRATKEIHLIIFRVMGVLTDEHFDDEGHLKGGYSVDHDDNNPANNRLSNLRLVRKAVNSMLKSDGNQVGFNKRDKKYEFKLPMHNHFVDNDLELSEEMIACKYDKGVTRNTIATEEEAIAEKKRAGIAMLNQLKKLEPEIFIAYKYSGSQASPRVQFSMEAELRALFS